MAIIRVSRVERTVFMYSVTPVKLRDTRVVTILRALEAIGYCRLTSPKPATFEARVNHSQSLSTTNHVCYLH